MSRILLLRRGLRVREMLVIRVEAVVLLRLDLMVKKDLGVLCIVRVAVDYICTRD